MLTTKYTESTDKQQQKICVLCIFVIIFFSFVFVTTFTHSCLAAADNQHISKKIDRLIANGGYILSKNGASIASSNADTQFIPASTLKIVTSLAALDILGPGFRFKTNFYLTEDNDLFIKGFGDPYLTSEEITIILGNLQQRGVSRINGIYLDASAFQLTQTTEGAGKSLNPYDAANSALATNFNTINFIKQDDGTIVSAEVQTPTLPMMQRLGKQLAAGEHRINITSNHKNMLIHTGELFRALQKRMGIAGDGPITVKHTPPHSPPIYTHFSSKTLLDIISGLMLYSNNYIANQIFLACGAQRLGYPATWEKSRSTFKTFLAGLGFTAADIVMVEGSGLSRNNQITPAAMLKILHHFSPYAHLLASDKGRLIKSGTLTEVYSYAGYFQAEKNSSPFVLILNQKKNTRDKLLNLLEKMYQQP